MDKVPQKSTFSAVSSGYSSGSMSSQNPNTVYQSNENCSVRIDNNMDLSSIINNYEKRSPNYSNNKGFTSYVTGGHNNFSEISDDFDDYEQYRNDANVARIETIVNRGSFDPSSTEKLSAPYVNDEKLVQEVLAKAGPSFTYQRAEFKNDIGSLANEFINGNNENTPTEGILDEFDENANYRNLDKPTYSSSSSINQDTSPLRIVKPNNQQSIVYKQQVNIRYLQPPTPPPPAPIIIREKQCAAQPKQSPIIIRQTEPSPSTPAPLIIREKAPTPPAPTEPTVIERPVAPEPLPPRQVIIERVPAPPPKPRQIIYEKWLPYKSTNRPVIVQKLKPQPAQEAPKNIIIEYEKMKAVSVRTVFEEGVFRVDPNNYQSYQGIDEGNSEIRYVDHITDLPVENSRILEKLNLEPANNLNLMNNKFFKTSELNASENLNTERESYNNFLQQFLNTPRTCSAREGNNEFGNSQPPMQQYTKTPSGNLVKNLVMNNSYVQNSEYETITTSVPESLARKIIAEAQAAGAINKTTKF